MDGKSLDVKREKIEKLKAILPEVFTEGKVDAEKLKLTLGEDVNINNERYVLNWAGKGEAFKVLQTPTTATLTPAPEESINFEKTEHVFIEGENLEVLKALQKSYYGKVKMIYIDPPYNTGNDTFIYPDRFSESKDEYLKRIGEKDEEGYLLKEGLFRKNSKENGQFHSNWLSMMYPRLFLARNLLREDGVIFVSIDDNEVHNLRLLMNEIFGEENFVGCFIWNSRQNVDSRDLTGASVDHEYVICYIKNPGTRIAGREIDKSKYKNPDNDPRGSWMSSAMDGIATKEKRPNLHFEIVDPKTGIKYRPNPANGWRFQKSTIEQLMIENRILWPKNPDSKPRFKRYLNGLKSDFTNFSTILEAAFTLEGTRELRDIMGMETLKFPKPIDLVTQLIKQGDSENKNEIILDFFAGSGTTAHAVLDLNKEDGGNRKFICVQLPEKTDENSEAYKAGYKTIADIAKERIRRVIKNIGGDLGFKVFKLRNSNFKIWRSDLIENGDDLAKQLDAFENPVKPEAAQTNMLWEILLKSGYDLNTKVEEKKLHNSPIYSINEGEMIIALAKIDEPTIKAIVEQKPQRCICLDSLFAGNDQLKTNTALQMKDAGIEFKTI